VSDHHTRDDGRPVDPTPADAEVCVVERRRHPDRHERDLEFLARAATEWVELSPDQDILAFTGRRLWEVIGDAAMLVSEFEPATRVLRCHAFIAAPEVQATWRRIAVDPLGQEAPVNDLAFEGLTQGRLVVVPGGLDVLTFGVVPPAAARALEPAIGFRQSYAMGFTLRRELYGSLAIIARQGTDLPDPRIIEAFVNQATAALQRRRAEQELRESEHRFRELADQLPLSVIEIEGQGRIRFANREARRIGGGDLDGLTVFDAFGADNGDLVAADFASVLRGEPLVGREYAGRFRDGSIYHVGIWATPIVRGGAIVGVRAISVDMSERRRAEAARQRLEGQLQHAERLESLAVLAGGLAHDYNNLLVAVLGNAELALTGLKPGSAAFERVRKIQNAARRAAELTDKLLDYSGRRHFVLQPLVLNDLVRDVCEPATGALGEPGVLSLELAATLPPIDGEPAQVRQVLTNLLSNAAEAIEGGGGSVTVRTGTMRGDAPELRDAYLGGELLPEDYVYLEVDDTGPGMDEATRARVFDPFFTTKFAGRGLGMAAVLGIVRTHRGAITVDSAVGRGTTFRVLFRVAAERAD
jgi:PAS domain S-box-containing protein